MAELKQQRREKRREKQQLQEEIDEGVDAAEEHQDPDAAVFGVFGLVQTGEA